HGQNSVISSRIPCDSRGKFQESEIFPQADFATTTPSVSLFSLVWLGIVEVLMCRERARNSLGRVFVAQVSAYFISRVELCCSYETDHHITLSPSADGHLYTVLWTNK
uniref:Uncharacterized protein n=1 Tax=Sinocyclocheilus anshuiensis TaxID=1608454 RepID=A0A671Q9G0_9TELE